MHRIPPARTVVAVGGGERILSLSKHGRRKTLDRSVRAGETNAKQAKLKMQEYSDVHTALRSPCTAAYAGSSISIILIWEVCCEQLGTGLLAASDLLSIVTKLITFF